MIDHLKQYLDSDTWESTIDNITACGLFPALLALPAPVVGIEIGVKEGMNSIALLEKCANISKITGIDPFKPYNDLGYYWSVEEQDALHDMLLKNVRIRNCTDRFELIRSTSQDAVSTITDNSVNFIFIDGEHTDSVVTAELNAYWSKLVNGGIMSGHDFDKIGNAVRAWHAAHRHEIDSEIYQLKHSSWYFIKK